MLLLQEQMEHASYFLFVVLKFCLLTPLLSSAYCNYKSLALLGTFVLMIALAITLALQLLPLLQILFLFGGKC